MIVCDVWDLHHSKRAVDRLNEFAPRLNDFLNEARRRGAVIVHSPSDCMPQYEEHPARRRAREAGKGLAPPAEVSSWCLRIPSEEEAAYPIDQSDGGEDDDPAEHRAWAAELERLGRNPKMPWKRQLAAIEIDAGRDYISDRGEEVWRILAERGIENVILTGVHVNMCVLGRPFGLRRMVAAGKRTALVRDLTDSMYNPRRPPYVDHFTGTDLVISHIERHVCPTITSDQLLGGEPFRFAGDRRAARDVTDPPPAAEERLGEARRWRVLQLPGSRADLEKGAAGHEGPVWLRCAVRVPAGWRAISPALVVPLGDSAEPPRVWLNGAELSAAAETAEGLRYPLPVDKIEPDTANLVVLRAAGFEFLAAPPRLIVGKQSLPLAGGWQFRLDDDPGHSAMPLPAQFGAPTDIVFPFE